MRTRTNKNISNGSTVVEIAIAAAIFLSVATTSGAALSGVLSATRRAQEQSFATTYATQGVEAVYSMASVSWEDLVIGTYGVVESSGQWDFVADHDMDGSGKFRREVTISEVQRDGLGDIVESGGTVDNDTFGITSRVVWEHIEGRESQIEISAIVTNWHVSVPVGY